MLRTQDYTGFRLIWGRTVQKTSR